MGRRLTRCREGGPQHGGAGPHARLAKAHAQFPVLGAGGKFGAQRQRGRAVAPQADSDRAGGQAGRAEEQGVEKDCNHRDTSPA